MSDDGDDETTQESGLGEIDVLRAQYGAALVTIDALRDRVVELEWALVDERARWIAHARSPHP